MSSVDATSPQGETAAAPVPVTHPRWCDRSLCTAPEFKPTELVRGTSYYHRSGPLAVSGDWAPIGSEGVIAYLSQAVGPWDCSVYLVVNDIHIGVGWSSPLLWALVDEHAEIGERWPLLMETGRAVARRLQEEAKQGARS